MVTHDQEEALTMADRIVVMNHGVIEQVGTATEIYRNPATPFVADFIGTMTFLHGFIRSPGTVAFGSVELACAGGTDGHRPGTPVTIAIRPEDVAIRNVGQATANRFEARIVDMEFLGSFYRGTLAPTAAEDQRITADFSINAVRDLGLVDGMMLPVVLPPDRIRVFAKS
jgi:iron(III) transport system ATP-binding protein